MNCHIMYQLWTTQSARRTFSEPLRALALNMMPWLPAAAVRESHFCRLYAIWDGWIQHMLARGRCSEDDDSMWACMQRVRDPATGADQLASRQSNDR